MVISCDNMKLHAFVAQLAEHRTCNAGVVGSTPIEGSNVGVAQLVRAFA
jgi:hypothetical protein